MPHPEPNRTNAAPPVTATPTTRRAVGKLIRLRADEAQAIAERARVCGRPVARYIREVALGVTPRARRTQPTAELIRELARLGNNLNQLTRVANIRGEVDEARLRAVLDEVVATIARIE